MTLSSIEPRTLRSSPAYLEPDYPTNSHIYNRTAKDSCLSSSPADFASYRCFKLSTVTSWQPHSRPISISQNQGLSWVFLITLVHQTAWNAAPRSGPSSVRIAHRLELRIHAAARIHADLHGLQCDPRSPPPVGTGRSPEKAVALPGACSSLSTLPTPAPSLHFR